MKDQSLNFFFFFFATDQVNWIEIISITSAAVNEFQALCREEFKYEIILTIWKKTHKMGSMKFSEH